MAGASSPTEAELQMRAMRRGGVALVLVVALLAGELHYARTAAAQAPATEPPADDQSPEPPADEPQAPGPAASPPPHRRPPPPKDDPAPPRLVIPPQEPGGVGAIMNRTLGCNTLLVFGDSTVDPGNNNHLQTTARANFLPYGLNFFGRRPTGRFTNGRLATDMIGTFFSFLFWSSFHPFPSQDSGN